MTNHKLQLAYDTATGKLTAVQSCTMEINGVEYTHAEYLDPGDDAGDVAGALREMIEQNRARLEAATRAKAGL